MDFFPRSPKDSGDFRRISERVSQNFREILFRDFNFSFDFSASFGDGVLASLEVCATKLTRAESLMVSSVEIYFTRTFSDSLTTNKAVTIDFLPFTVFWDCSNF